MCDECIELDSKIISITELQIQKSKDLIYAIEQLPFVQLVDCRKNEDCEIVTFDLSVQVPQKKKNDIRSIERIAVEFSNKDKYYPNVLALRKDFPKVPHQYQNKNEFPRSLCLYEAPYSEINFSWTATSFIERIRDWLKLTAIDKLHRKDQPLEPLLSNYDGVIILPGKFCEDSGKSFLKIKRIYTQNNGITIFRSQLSEDPNIDIGYSIVGLVLKCPPSTHGIMYKTPSDINDLDNILKVIGMDFISKLRDNLFKSSLNLGKKFKTKFLNSDLIIILLLPKSRTSNGDIENTEICAFITTDPVRKIGEEIGIWKYLPDYKDIGIILPNDTYRKGETIQLYTLNTISEFNKNRAISLSSLDNKISNKSILCIGVGALGSQIFENSIRMGLNKWTLLDDDILSPHNLARHSLTSEFIGLPKVESLKKMAENILSEKNFVKAYKCDILSLNKSEPNFNEIIDSLSSTDLILDISTSIPVARSIAIDITSNKRRASMFINPQGTDLVILCEDSQRNQRLDVLEMQYYRGLGRNKKLSDHLFIPKTKIMYSNSCRDITNQVSQDSIALCASIGTNELKNILSDKKSSIKIWITNKRDFTSEVVKIRTSPMIKLEVKDWDIITDKYVINKMQRYRKSKTPNETGGVVIGSYDFKRKIIYVVDLYKAPKDSIEGISSFVRGCDGLEKILLDIKKRTDGRLCYIGEWHSHPDNHITLQSDNDINAFNWQRGFMTKNGQIPLMLICGSDDYMFHFETQEGKRLAVGRELK